MILRRPYADRLILGVLGVLPAAGAVRMVTLPGGPGDRWIGAVVALLLAALSVAFLRYALLPFRITVDRLGWDVRTPDLRRHLRWEEIAALVITKESERAGRRETSPRVLVVPVPGVELKTPTSVDGRPAVELFQLSEVDYDETRLVRELAVLAGDRLDNRCAVLNRPAGEIVLDPLSSAADHIRLRRWLNRRNALLLAGWYLLVLLPALALVILAARVHEVLGAVVLIAGLIAVAAAGLNLGGIFSGCRSLADRTATLDGADLVTWHGSVSRRTSLHSGTVALLPPRSKRGYGKAWLLADPEPWLLLGDPRTGRLRNAGGLRTLAAVLRESPAESDRAVGRQLDELSVQAPLAAPEIGDASAGDLWLALTAAGRVVAWLVVVATVALAGGAIVETTSFVGPVLIFGAAGLFGVWVCYALYRILGLLVAAVRAVR
ncbi:hypothetical protein AB0F81_28090 [Actinoplanes sp. NPDC024001]|uniref:hypothetical protein n=1 Tax=Actinoplanes sp. NPDC024001 TaxID=3154598 RepID=UPI003409BF9F